jgi:hypothetical protein
MSLECLGPTDLRPGLLSSIEWLSCDRDCETRLQRTVLVDTMYHKGFGPEVRCRPVRKPLQHPGGRRAA